MKNPYLFLFILFLMHGCGYKTHDVYFDIKNGQGWKDKYFNTSWTKEHRIDNNTTITVSGLNVSAYSAKKSYLNFEKKTLKIVVEYQSYDRHVCKKEDIYIKVNNKIKHPFEGEDAYYGDVTPPIIGCAYLYKINPKQIEEFVVYFNNEKHQIPPITLQIKEEDRYHAVELM